MDRGGDDRRTAWARASGPWLSGEADRRDDSPVIIETALDSLITRREGRTLLRLLTDPVVADSEVLHREVQSWCYEIRGSVYLVLSDDAEDEGDLRGNLDKLHEVGDPVLTAPLGRALLNLAG